MTRNLESRVEFLTPVEDEAMRAELGAVFDVQLADRRNVWDMNSDGAYVWRREAGNSQDENCQQALIAAAERRNFEANRLRKRKPRVLSRRARR
jgi:polyphosphate kinase